MAKSILKNTVLSSFLRTVLICFNLIGSSQLYSVMDYFFFFF